MSLAAAWFAAGAISSCVDTAEEQRSTAGAAEGHAAAGHPCCGQLAWTGQEQTSEPTQHET